MVLIKPQRTFAATKAKATTEYQCPPNKLFKVPCETVKDCQRAFAKVKQLKRDQKAYAKAFQDTLAAVKKRQLERDVVKARRHQSEIATLAAIAKKDKDGAILFSVLVTGTVVLLVAGVVGGVVGWHLATQAKQK